MNKQLQAIVDSSWDITQALMPSKHMIYHYTSPHGLLGILHDGGEAKLFFTQYDSLNDKSERIHAENLIRKICQEYLEKKQISPDFFNVVCDCLNSRESFVTYPSPSNPAWVSGERCQCDTYLCCFSENNDSLPMWNYYSKSKHYEGYNIGFYIDNEPQDFLQGYGLDIVKVIYDDSQKQNLIENLILSIYEKYKGYSKESSKNWLISELQLRIDSIILAFKDRHFAHEEEVRIILRMPTKHRQNGHGRISKRNYRDTNGYIIPYVEYTFAKGRVYEIHIAPLLNSKVAKQNVDDLLKQRGYPPVPVIPSEIPIRF
jgi:hypothetical protein